MSEEKMNGSLAEIVKSVTSNTTILNSVQSNNETVIELLNVIYQRVEDMGKKFDEVLNIGLKKPKISPKQPNKKKATSNTDAIKTEIKPSKKTNLDESNNVVSLINTPKPKPVKNIMTYFKTKYMENDAFFNDILEENQDKSTFEENKVNIDNKKEGIVRNKYKTSLLYKKLSKEQKNKIREKMINEHERSIINNSDEIAEESESS
jgi:hypothetical protein